MEDAEEVKRGIDIATGFIAYRMRSEYEVRRRLRRAQLSEENVVAVVARLKAMRLVDDKAFSAAYCRDKIIGDQLGPVRASKGLSSLGVGTEIAAAAIDQVLADHDTLATAVTLGRKRWQKLDAGIDLLSRKKRVYDYLVRRGYPFNDARRVVDQLEEASE